MGIILYILVIIQIIVWSPFQVMKMIIWSKSEVIFINTGLFFQIIRLYRDSNMSALGVISTIFTSIMPLVINIILFGHFTSFVHQQSNVYLQPNNLLWP